MTPSDSKKVVYCHCAYTKVIPEATKTEVLGGLAAGDRSFEAVADLCDLVARRDPSLQDFATSDVTDIVACFPRALKWLFHSAGHELADSIQIHNMRTESADDILGKLEGEPEARAEGDAS